MAEKDVSEKMLADYNDVFSDIVNVLLFQGKCLLKEEELENTKDISQYKVDGKLHEQERDLTKRWNKEGIIISLLGMENQTCEDTDMPMRIISYDGASYKTQCLSDNKDRYPVVTLVLHFGTNHRWNTARQLSDMFPVADSLKPYFHDYSINVFDIAYLSEEQINMFQSDFKVVADYFRQKRVKGDYIPGTEIIKHVDEVMKLLSALTGSRSFEFANKELKKEGGKITMCEVVDKIENRGRLKGRQEGRQEGRQSVLIELVKEGILAVWQAAEMAGLDVEAFEHALQKS